MRPARLVEARRRRQCQLLAVSVRSAWRRPPGERGDARRRPPPARSAIALGGVVAGRRSLLVVAVDVIGHHEQVRGRVRWHPAVWPLRHRSAPDSLPRRNAWGPRPGRSVTLADVTRVPVRDDLRAMEGYHSPQVDVRVRLNTNESPFLRRPHGGTRSPPSCRGSSGTATPTAAPASCGRGSRPCTASPPSRCSRPTAATRCCRRWCSPSPAPVAPSPRSNPRTRCTARSPGSPAPPVVEGERGADFTLDLAEVDPSHRHRVADGHLPLLAEQPHRPRRARGQHPRGARQGARPAGGRRGLRPVRRRGPALGAGRPTMRRSWSPARSPRPGRWRPLASGT